MSDVLADLAAEVATLPEWFHEGRMWVPLGDVIELIELARDEMGTES